MGEITSNVNWVAVIVGAVVAFILGWLWYSPKLFGTKWAEGVGVSLGAATGMPVAAMVTQVIATFFLSWVVGVTAAHNALMTMILITLTIVLLMISGSFFTKKSNYAIATRGRLCSCDGSDHDSLPSHFIVNNFYSDAPSKGAYMYKNYSLVLICGMLISTFAFSEDATYEKQPAPEILKHFIELEGEWVGTHTNHEGDEEQLNLIYRTVSGGTAVEERIFADSPKEMVTVYHGAGDDGVLMTHYCMLGNQPRLQLSTSNGNIFDFQYFDGVGIEREKTGHMGGMKMTILDENTIQQEWAYYEDGEVKSISKFTFTRK